MADERLLGSGDEYSSTPRPPQIVFVHERIVMGYFSESDIDQVGAIGNSSIYLTFFGICLGTFFTLLGVFLGSEVTDPKKYAAGMALMFVSLLGSLVFGALGRSEYKKSNAKREEIKKRFRNAPK